MFATLRMLLIATKNDSSVNPVTKELTAGWDTATYSQLKERTTKLSLNSSTNFTNWCKLVEGVPFYDISSDQCRDGLISYITGWTRSFPGNPEFTGSSYNIRIYCRMDSVDFSEAYFDKAKKLSAFKAIYINGNEFYFDAKDFDVMRFSLFEMLLRSTDFLSIDDVSDSKRLISAMLENHSSCFPNNSDTYHLTVDATFAIYTDVLKSSSYFKGYQWPFDYINGVSTGMEVYIESNLGTFFEFMQEFNIDTKILSNIATPLIRKTRLVGGLRLDDITIKDLYNIYIGKSYIMRATPRMAKDKSSSWSE